MASDTSRGRGVWWLAAVLLVVGGLLFIGRIESREAPNRPEGPMSGGCRLLRGPWYDPKSASPGALKRQAQPRSEAATPPPAPTERIAPSYSERQALFSDTSNIPVAIKRGQCDTAGPTGGDANACGAIELRCGDVIIDTTAPGPGHFGSRFYERNFCTPATTRHDERHERVYRVVVDQPDVVVTAVLDTPCTPLDLAIFQGDVLEACPDDAYSTPHCEMDVNPKARKALWMLSRDVRVAWIVVEGQDGGDGAPIEPFGLSILCSPVDW